MDIVLGVSMAPASVQMVLLQGENADGATVDESEFAVMASDDSHTVSASDRVVAAILDTRDDAVGAGLELSSVGVACTDQLEAAALRDALAAHKVENVMLVSAFLAAAALTQSVGGAMGYERTAVLFVEPETATLAIVETSDGSLTDIHEEPLDSTSRTSSTAELMALVAGLDELPTRPGGLLVVGSGVDITAIKPNLQEATSLTVSAPEEPETALARGAALASANVLASSTAVLAYAQDPGTGALDVSALPEYLSITDDDPDEGLAYSAVPDDEASAPTVVIDASGESGPRRRPGLLVGTALAVAAISAALALEIALSLGIRSTVGLLPAPIHDLIAPVQEALVPVPGPVAATKAVAPRPVSPPAGAPPAAAPVPAAPPPLPAAPILAAPVPAAPVVPVPVPLPAAPIPVPAAPVPAAPVPVVVLPPIAPAPVPPVHLPEPPASPPMVQPPPHASPPAEPPPVHVPPPHAPPPYQNPPGQGQGPNPGGRPGGPSGSPGDGGPPSGPGPVHGNPGGGGPHGGGPLSGPGSGHGTPTGPPEGGMPPGGSEPHTGGLPPGGSEPHTGGLPPGGGGENHRGSGSFGGDPHSGGGPAGGGTSSGGGETGGGSIGGGSVGGGSESGGSTSSSGGGADTGGSSSSSSGGADSG